MAIYSKRDSSTAGSPHWEEVAKDGRLSVLRTTVNCSKDNNSHVKYDDEYEG